MSRGSCVADPLTGHFTQADTLIPEPGKASAFDRYAYVLNNPIRYTDPSGHGIDSGIGDSGYDRSGDLKRWRGYTQQKNKKRLSQTPTTLPVPTPFFSRTSTPIPLPMSTPTPYPRSTTGTAFTATTTPTASLTIDMSNLNEQLLFHENIGTEISTILEALDMVFLNANRLSNSHIYRLTKGVSPSASYEAVIAILSQGYKDKDRTDIGIIQKLGRVSIMGGEAIANDWLSSALGGGFAIGGALGSAPHPEIGAAVGYITGSTLTSYVVDDIFKMHINPAIFPLVGLGEY